MLERLGIAYRELLGFGSLRFVVNGRYVLQDLDLLVLILRKLAIFEERPCYVRTRSFYVEMLNSRRPISSDFANDLVTATNLGCQLDQPYV